MVEKFRNVYDVRFLELFANIKVDENLAEKIISRYNSGRYLQIAKMIQYYEYEFWEGIRNAEEKGSS